MKKEISLVVFFLIALVVVILAIYFLVKEINVLNGDGPGKLVLSGKKDELGLEKFHKAFIRPDQEKDYIVYWSNRLKIRPDLVRFALDKVGLNTIEEMYKKQVFEDQKQDLIREGSVYAQFL